VTELSREFLEGILKTFSLGDGCSKTLFEHLEDFACVLAYRLRSQTAKKNRSLNRGLAKEYFSVARSYAAGFEALCDDPVISWYIENGTFGRDKIKLLRKKKENLCETIKVLKQTLKNPNSATHERIEWGRNLAKTRRKLLRKEAKAILEEVSSFVANKRAMEE
jgi:hypothetical protein